MISCLKTPILLPNKSGHLSKILLRSRMDDLVDWYFLNQLDSKEILKINAQYYSKPIVILDGSKKNNRPLTNEYDADFLTFYENQGDLLIESSKRKHLTFSEAANFLNEKVIKNLFNLKKTFLNHYILNLKKIKKRLMEKVTDHQVDYSNLFTELKILALDIEKNQFQKLIAGKSILSQKIKMNPLEKKIEIDNNNSVFILDFDKWYEHVYILEDVSDYSLAELELWYFFISQLQNQSENSKDQQNWQSEIYQQLIDGIPIPFAMFNASYNLEFANSLMTKLGLKKTFIQQEPKQVEINHSFYRVNYRWLDYELDKKRLITMHSLQDTALNKESNAEELGIVSSSLAHELKNPIAGILAALEYLLLEDYSQSSIETLQEMKQTCIRAQRIVETFLGFSRAAPQVFSFIDQNPTSYRDEFLQAYDLIRFRLMEKNIKLEVQDLIIHNFSYQMNRSVLVMLFYIILGEFLTFTAHSLLVDGLKSQTDQLIKYREDHDSIVLQFTIHKSLEEIYQKHGLIKNLIKLLNLNFEFNMNELILSAN